MKLCSCVSNVACNDKAVSLYECMLNHYCCMQFSMCLVGESSKWSKRLLYVSGENFSPEAHTLWKDLAHRKLWKPWKIIFTCSACCGSLPGLCGATHLAETTFRTLWNLAPHFADKPKKAICLDLHTAETMFNTSRRPCSFAETRLRILLRG